jgi:CheY-like chemotaxis protein
VKKGLDAEHHAVDVSNDGEQARAMAAEFDYDLVVLDLNLPQLDGIAILRYLRTRKPSMPILVLTGRTRVEDRAQCLDLGADDYLGKPFSFTELSARIRALLRRSHMPAESVLTIEDEARPGGTQGGAGVTSHRSDWQRICSTRIPNAQCGPPDHPRHDPRARWNLSFDTCTNVVDVYVNYLASCKLLPAGRTALLQLDLAVAFPLIDILVAGHGSALSRDVNSARSRSRIWPR